MIEAKDLDWNNPPENPEHIYCKLEIRWKDKHKGGHFLISEEELSCNASVRDTLTAFLNQLVKNTVNKLLDD